MLGTTDTAPNNGGVSATPTTTSGLASAWATIDSSFWAIGNAAYDGVAFVYDETVGQVKTALSVVEVVLILLAIGLILLIIYNPGALGAVAKAVAI